MSNYRIEPQSVFEAYKKTGAMVRHWTYLSILDRDEKARYKSQTSELPPVSDCGLCALSALAVSECGFKPESIACGVEVFKSVATGILGVKEFDADGFLRKLSSGGGYHEVDGFLTGFVNGFDGHDANLDFYSPAKCTVRSREWCVQYQRGYENGREVDNLIDDALMRGVLVSFEDRNNQLNSEGWASV